MTMIGFFLLSSCGIFTRPSLRLKVNSKEIPYQELHHYFVGNDYADQDLHAVVMRKRTEFDRILHPAATMGKDGMPTPVDFEKNYVVALVGKTTEHASEITIEKVSASSGEIIIHARHHEGNLQTFSIRPLRLIAIGNAFRGNVSLKLVTEKQ